MRLRTAPFSLCLVAAVCLGPLAVAAEVADPNAPAEFAVTEKVLRPAEKVPPLGANGWGRCGAIEWAANNFVRNSGNEPIHWQNLHRAMKVGPNWFEIDGGGASWYDLWASGFLSGADVRIYRLVDKEGKGLPPKGGAHRLACMLPVVGVLGPFIWGSEQAQFWLVVPTSLFGMVLAPIAYWTFFFMMNSRGLLGENMPRGGRRVVWNTLMLVAAGAATFGSVWVLWSNFQWKGVGVLAAFLGLALAVHVARKRARRM